MPTQRPSSKYLVAGESPSTMDKRIFYTMLFTGHLLRSPSVASTSAWASCSSPPRLCGIPYDISTTFHWQSEHKHGAYADEILHRSVSVEKGCKKWWETILKAISGVAVEYWQARSALSTSSLGYPIKTIPCTSASYCSLERPKASSGRTCRSCAAGEGALGRAGCSGGGLTTSTEEVLRDLR